MPPSVHFAAPGLAILIEHAAHILGRAAERFRDPGQQAFLDGKRRHDAADLAGDVAVDLAASPTLVIASVIFAVP